MFIAFALLFCRRRAHGAFVAVVVATLPFAALAVFASPYRRARIFAFIDPWKDPQNTGFHIVQSLLALGSGGHLRRRSRRLAREVLLSARAYTDFIFSVLGEELGLIGTIVVIALFVTLAYRSVRIALVAPDRFGFFLAIGCAAHDYHSGLHQHRRRHVVVAGNRRSASVHLVRRQLAHRQSDRRRHYRQRRTPSPSRRAYVTVVFAGRRHRRTPLPGHRDRRRAAPTRGQNSRSSVRPAGSRRASCRRPVMLCTRLRRMRCRAGSRWSSFTRSRPTSRARCRASSCSGASARISSLLPAATLASRLRWRRESCA